MSLSARQAALESIGDYAAAPTGLVEYRSQGRVLVVGGREALFSAAQMHSPLLPHIVLTEPSDLARGKSVVTPLQGRSMQLEGWLGAFHLTLTDALGVSSTLAADLVLDLGDTPLMARQIQAPGYFYVAAGEREARLPELIGEITDSVGTFAKPKFFEYDASICAHSRSGLPGCNRCIEACPAEAIISIGEGIRVEPHLCQGGGTCTTACPSGAIRYNYPAPAFHVDQIRRMLKAYREAGGEDAHLLFYRAGLDLQADALPAPILPVALEELASVGAEVWMTALSFGVSRVLLLDDDDTPALSRTHLQEQIALVHTLLAAMAYPPEALALVTAIPQAAGVGMPAIKPATQAGLDNKRQQWMLALEHLQAEASVQPAEIPLPAGSPFGRLQVDKDSCTLCMACATICPAQAISGGIDAPQLRFFTNNCVQCGLCVRGCPEQAITLEPVYLTSREQRQKPLLLNEEQPFHCISCGKPFASQSMIQLMLGKLQAHPMFQSERAQRRLEMCEDCRVVDVVQDDEAMGMPTFGETAGKIRLH